MYDTGDIVRFVLPDSKYNKILKGKIIDVYYPAVDCMINYTILDLEYGTYYCGVEEWQIIKSNKSEEKQMKKSDLKNRMVVETRNGNRYLVVDDYLLAINGKGFLFLSSYTDDLTNKDKLTTDPIEEKINREFDIMKIYDRTTQWNYLKGIDLLWERKEVVTMTLSDIKKKLGVDNLKIICSNPNDYIFECELK